MPYELYLEFEEDDLSVQIEQNGDDEYKVYQNNDDEFNRDEDEIDEEDLRDEDHVVFIPYYLYRSYLDDTVKIDIDFDPSEYDILHLIVGRYTREDQMAIISGKWHIIGVCETRRKAKETVDQVESGELENDAFPWNHENVELDHVEVISLRVED